MRLSDLVQQNECLTTRVWGFTPETWGAMGFPKPGTTDKWVAAGLNRRVVCFVSHHPADHIKAEDCGRVLGVYELSPERVQLESDDVLDRQHLVDRAMRHEDGRFRWPVGLRAVKAWRFQPKAPRTREAMPDARSWSHNVSTDLVQITAMDFGYLDQERYGLIEVPVYGVDFSPARIAAPVAVPSSTYVFATRRKDVLIRLPGWCPGEILVKIGCTSDVEARLNQFNNHPLARIFDFKLSKVASRHIGTEDAYLAESELLAWATRAGRPAANLSTEFFFLREPAYDELLQRFAQTIRVA